MHLKNTLVTILIAVSCFVLGWVLHRPKPPAAALLTNTAVARTLPVTEPDVVTLADTFPDMHSTSPETIRGKFILDGTDSAGYNFISSTLVSRINESASLHPDTFRLHWINPTIFYLRDLKPMHENSLPRVWIYSVEFYDGSNLKLHWYNTFWVDGRDEDESFHRG